MNIPIIVHCYPEKPHAVYDTIKPKTTKNNFFAMQQDPTIVNLTDSNETIIITNCYDDKLYPLN